MTKLPDPALLEIATQYSPVPPDEVTKEGMPTIRANARAAKVALRGRLADQVEVLEEGTLRRFVPSGDLDSSCLIIYVHGGGWVNCDTVTHGAIMTDLAALTGYEVWGPDYPLAPEHVYPAGLDAVCALITQAASERPDAEIVVGGDSAGANLALAAALRMRDEGQPALIKAMLLWYGCYRNEFETRSHRAYGGGAHGLETVAMKRMWDWYLDDHPNPTYGDLTMAAMNDLPPAYLCEAELDCLADDTKWLADLLAKEGINFAYEFFPDVNHGFIHFGEFYEPSFQALKGAAHFLKRVRG